MNAAVLALQPDRSGQAVHGRRTLRIAEETPEFAVYAALKLYVCRRASTETRSHDTTVGWPSPLTSRRIHHLLINGKQGPEGPPGPLYGVSSYFLRERLKILNHGTALREKGRGLRNSLTYEWAEPLDSSTLKTYRRLEALLGEGVTLGFDLHLIDGTFGREPFTLPQFTAAVQRRRSSATTKHRGAARPSMRETDFHRARLEELERLKLVAGQKNMYRLTPKGERAAHWFDLFMAPVKIR